MTLAGPSCPTYTKELIKHSISDSVIEYCKKRYARHRQFVYPVHLCLGDCQVSLRESVDGFAES